MTKPATNRIGDNYFRGGYVSSIFLLTPAEAAHHRLAMESALLDRVRIRDPGTDRFNHFSINIPAHSNLQPDAIKRHAELQQPYQATAGKA